MILQALSKLVFRTMGYQAKTACGNLQLCVGLEDGIEGAYSSVGDIRREGGMRLEREVGKEAGYELP